MVRRNGNRNSKIRVLRSKNMSTKKSEKIKDDFIIMKKLIKQKLDEWDTGNIQNEINKISILEDKPSGSLILTHQGSADSRVRTCYPTANKSESAKVLPRKNIFKIFKISIH